MIAPTQFYTQKWRSRITGPVSSGGGRSMNVPKIETANNVTPIARLDVPGGGQIYYDAPTDHMSLDRLSCLEIVQTGAASAQ
jgi:hypothetical protein